MLCQCSIPIGVRWCSRVMAAMLTPMTRMRSPGQPVPMLSDQSARGNKRRTASKAVIECELHPTRSVVHGLDLPEIHRIDAFAAAHKKGRVVENVGALH